MAVVVYGMYPGMRLQAETDSVSGNPILFGARRKRGRELLTGTSLNTQSQADAVMRNM